MHGQSQNPAARLAGCPPRSSVVPIGAIQEQSVLTEKTRPRQEELAGKANQGTFRDAPRVPARPGERQASGPDKTTAAARRLPRQATTLYPHSSTSTNVSPWGPFQARVARGCAASGARWHAKLTRLPTWRAVAPLTVPFYTVWATQTGLQCLCPLPAGLRRMHCAGGCTNRNPFSTFTLLCVATCR